MQPIVDIYGFLKGNLAFSQGLWLLIKSLAFALLCLLFIGSLRNGRVKGRQTFIEAGLVALWYVVALLLGMVTFNTLSEKGNQVFHPLWTPAYPALVWCIAAAILLVVLVWIYLKRKKKFADQVSSTAIRRSAAWSGAGKYARALLFGGLLVMSLLSWVGSKGSFATLIPLVATELFLLLAALTRWRIWYALGALVIAAFAVLLMQQVLALEGFGVTPLISFIPLYLSVILPLITLTFLKKN